MIGTPDTAAVEAIAAYEQKERERVERWELALSALVGPDERDFSSDDLRQALTALGLNADYLSKPAQYVTPSRVLVGVTYSPWSAEGRREFQVCDDLDDALRHARSYLDGEIDTEHGSYEDVALYDWQGYPLDPEVLHPPIVREPEPMVQVIAAHPVPYEQVDRAMPPGPLDKTPRCKPGELITVPRSYAEALLTQRRARLPEV